MQSTPPLHPHDRPDALREMIERHRREDRVGRHLAAAREHIRRTRELIEIARRSGMR